uniref:hypothetical protein n=1 Tax=Fusicatenibacter saccharivorans TaxID=1150298 RepID=UPI00321A7F71
GPFLNPPSLRYVRLSLFPLLSFCKWFLKMHANPMDEQGTQKEITERRKTVKRFTSEKFERAPPERASES